MRMDRNTHAPGVSNGTAVVRWAQMYVCRRLVVERHTCIADLRGRCAFGRPAGASMITSGLRVRSWEALREHAGIESESKRRGREEKAMPRRREEEEAMPRGRGEAMPRGRGEAMPRGRGRGDATWKRRGDATWPAQASTAS